MSKLHFRLTYMLLIGGLYTFLFYQYLTGRYPGVDYAYHLKWAINITQNNFEIPHPGLHYSVWALIHFLNLTPLSAFLLVMGVSMVATMAIFAHIFRRLCPFSENPLAEIYFVVLQLGVGSLFIPGVSQGFYMGVGQPNPLHNPTFIMAKPLGVACLFFTVAFFSHYFDRTEWCQTDHREWSSRGNMGHLLACSALLIVSTYVKPNFTIAFMPALAGLILLHGKLFYRLSLVALAIICVPTVLLLVNQYFAAYGTNQGPSKSGGIMFDYFRLWHHYAPSLLPVVRRAILFPLALLVCRPIRSLKSPYFLIALLFYLIAFFQFGMLAESGPRYGSGNWMWGYNLALSILMLFGSVEFFRWMVEIGNGAGLFEKVRFGAVSIILNFHLASGMLYLIRIFKGQVGVS